MPSNRRIAQRQSASIHTEEAAAFNSCSAYHILFLSHCVPYPPDKGEKIRAYHELKHLSSRYRVHLACMTTSAAQAAQAQELKGLCASIYAEPLPRWTLAKAAVRFGAGESLTASYFDSPSFRRHIESLAKARLAATIVYSTVMAQHAPPGVPVILDMVDVDSEKWLQYGATRWPGWVYRVEGRRLRRMENRSASEAAAVFVSTESERNLFRRAVPGGTAKVLENGVDFEYFQPTVEIPTSLAGRKYLVFAGAMDYYPNADGAAWFGSEVFPELRRRDPELEFFVVGRNPAANVRWLGGREGITVTGSVPDVRPYIQGSRAAVVPLRIARGIQNKVLEALAMGKRVFASDAVCATFGAEVPDGVTGCGGEASGFIEAITGAPLDTTQADEAIRRSAGGRFQWASEVGLIAAEVERVACWLTGAGGQGTI